VIYGVFRTLKPDRLAALMGTTILVNRRPVTFAAASRRRAERNGRTARPTKMLAEC